MPISFEREAATLGPKRGARIVELSYPSDRRLAISSDGRTTRKRMVRELLPLLPGDPGTRLGCAR